MKSKVLKLATNKCKECGRTCIAKQVLMGVCLVCYRKAMFEAMSIEQQELLIKDLVRPRYVMATLDDLTVHLKEQLLACGDDGAYVWGPPGVGKTYALAALARHYIPQGYNVKRVSYAKLGLLIRDTFKQGRSDTEWGIIEPLMAADKLFLEDISSGVSIGRQETDFALRVVMVLLDARSEDCLPTFITGNKSVDELGRAFDEKISSRLRQGTIIHLTGKDRRATKNEND